MTQRISQNEQVSSPTQRVNSTQVDIKEFPYRAIASLHIIHDDSTYFCTATMISENCALTILHPLINKKKEYPRKIYLYAGRYMDKAYKWAKVVSFAFPSIALESEKIAHMHNYAILYLEDPIGIITGYIFPKYYDETMKEITLSGYVNDNGIIQIESHGTIVKHKQNELFSHNIITKDGQPGSALRIKFADEWRIIGIHTKKDKAIKMTENVFKIIKQSIRFMLYEHLKNECQTKSDKVNQDLHELCPVERSSNLLDLNHNKIDLQFIKKYIKYVRID